MNKPAEHDRVSILTVITAPLGFFVLALLIAEATLAVVLVFSDLSDDHKFYGLLMAVGMFVLVVMIVAVLVWNKPEHLTFDRDAHLIDRGKIPYGSDAHLLQASDLERLSEKPAPKGENPHE